MEHNADVASSPMRMRYTNVTKLRFLDKLEKTTDSIREFAKRKNISISMLMKWRKNRNLIELSDPRGFKVETYYEAYYAKIEESIHAAILDARSEGRPINYKWIQRMAKMINTQLPESDRHENAAFTNGWVKKFLVRYDLGVRRKSSCRNPSVAYGHVVEKFQRDILEIIHNYGIHKNNIFNMDETGCYFGMSPDYTIDKIGTKKISIVTNSASKKRFTCVFTIRADGTALKPLVIFKGKNRPKNLSIPEGIFSVEYQSNAWMTRDLMKKYIESLPFSDEPKLIIMDAFIVHKNTEILKLLQEKNYHTIFVPSGFTDILQPLDVGVMHPFKSAIKDVFTNWSNEQEFVNDRLPIPKPNTVLSWVNECFHGISNEIIQNSFVGANIIIPNIEDNNLIIDDINILNNPFI